MKWTNPEHKGVPASEAKKYTIRSGSVLDAPRTLLAWPRDFEGRLREHFEKSVVDTELLKAMVPIYLLYKEEGAVEVCSCLPATLRQRHEKVIVNLVRENLAHLVQLYPYCK